MCPDVKAFIDWVHGGYMGFSASSLREMTELARQESKYIGNNGWQHPTVKRRD